MQPVSSGGVQRAVADLDLQRQLGGRSRRWRKRLGADRRRWTGARGRNPFRDVNKIKEPDMIKHEVHYKGNVNLSPDPFIIKNRRSAALRRRRIYEADFLNLIEGFRCY